MSRRCRSRWALRAIGVMVSRTGGIAPARDDRPRCELEARHSGMHRANRSWPDFPGMGELLQWGRAPKTQEEVSK